MTRTEKQIRFNRISKYICWGVEIAFFAIFIILCVSVSKKSNELKQLKAQQEIVTNR